MGWVVLAQGLMRLQSSCWPGLQASEGISRAGGSTSKFGCWVRPCPRACAAFPQSKWCETVRQIDTGTSRGKSHCRMTHHHFWCVLATTQTNPGKYGQWGLPNGVTIRSGIIHWGPSSKLAVKVNDYTCYHYLSHFKSKFRLKYLF